VGDAARLFTLLSSNGMAKGLRSSSKVRFRGIKREKVFKPIEDARLARLAKKQAEAARSPSVGGSVDVGKPNFSDQVPATEESDVEMENLTPKIISTSGMKNKKMAKKLAKKKSKTAFNFGRK